MVRALIAGLAAALALAGAAPAAEAQTMRPPHHARAVRPGDIVVHSHRSYLNPGTAASPGEWGTGDRYVSDTTPYSFAQMGPPHAFGAQGFDVLPRLFDPPGRPEPIAEFW